MTARHGPGLIDPVSTNERVQVQLDLDPAADPIRGALKDVSGHAVEFSGWLGFAAAIEEVLAAAAAMPPEESQLVSRPD
jgi:hypothetical protein